MIETSGAVTLTRTSDETPTVETEEVNTEVTSKWEITEEGKQAFKDIQKELLAPIIEQSNKFITANPEMVDVRPVVVMSEEQIAWYHEKYALMCPPTAPTKNPDQIIGHTILETSMELKEPLVVTPYRYRGG